MPVKRKKHSAEFKAKVALDAIRSLKTAGELSTKYGVHSTQIARWKKQALDGLADIFGDSNPGRSKAEDDSHTAKLYEQIGRLQVELDWLKKKSDPLY